MSDALQAVVDGVGLLRRHYQRRVHASGDFIARELETALALLDGVDLTNADASQFQASGHAVTQLLGSLPSRGGAVADVLAALRPLFPALPWRYSYEPRGDGLENAMAWAEFIGPVAPFQSAKVCLGLTAIAPHTRYPEHRHPAVETYFVLSGAARWTAAGVTTEHAPGSFILHPSNIVHAMETGEEPLIAAYTWTGEVETLSSWDGAGNAIRT